MLRKSDKHGDETAEILKKNISQIAKFFLKIEIIWSNQSNECSSDSKCVESGNGYTCDCNDGFYGQHCKSQNPCDRKRS